MSDYDIKNEHILSMGCTVILKWAPTTGSLVYSLISTQGCQKYERVFITIVKITFSTPCQRDYVIKECEKITGDQ